MNLIYLVAVGANEPLFLTALEWCVDSLRRFGRYEDEIVVVSDQPAALSASVRSNATVLEVDADRLWDPRHGREGSERFLMARLVFPSLLDVSRYESVMYLDADILAIRDVQPLFDCRGFFRYAREFQPMSAPMFNASLTAEELETARWLRGVNSGTFVSPGPMLTDALDRWRAILDEQPGGWGYDQPALNALVLRRAIPARPLPAFAVGFPVFYDFAEHFREHTLLLHYCGVRHKKFTRMQLHYEELLAGRTPRVRFADEEAPGAAVGQID